MGSRHFDVLEWTDGNETLRAYPTLLDRGDSVSFASSPTASLERLLHGGSSVVVARKSQREASSKDDR